MAADMPPSLREFRECVLGAYASIMRDMGFVELPRRRGKYVNKFMVRIGNATTVIEVEGESYAMMASTRIFRAAEADGDRCGLPIRLLIERRLGLTAGQVEKASRRRRKQPDQRADIRDAAIAIMEHATDVLMGDFTELDEIAEQRRRRQQERLARSLAQTAEQSAAATASAKAGHAFKQQKYTEVVELLEPHLPLLPPSQRRRYELAKARAGAPQQFLPLARRRRSQRRPAVAMTGDGVNDSDSTIFRTDTQASDTQAEPVIVGPLLYAVYGK